MIEPTPNKFSFPNFTPPEIFTAGLIILKSPIRQSCPTVLERLNIFPSPILIFVVKITF